MTADLDGLPQQLLELLQVVSDDLVTQRLAADDDNDDAASFDPSRALSTAAPLFAALHAVNRKTLKFARECKSGTQEARLQMDAAHLRLQNLLYERNHLEREIHKCEEYESQYQDLPLLPAEDFAELYNQSTPPPGLVLPLPEDPHELMLARLTFELAERTRFDEEKKELGARKALLVKENEVKKKQLEDLEKQVDDFVAAAKAIQAKMHGPEGANATTTAPVTAAEVVADSEAMIEA